MNNNDLRTLIMTTPPFPQFVDLAATLERATLHRDGANVYVAFVDATDAAAFVKAYEELMAVKPKRK